MNNPLAVQGRLLARNTLLNVLGQAIPLLVGVVTIPFIVRGLGAERFGLLSLAWAILGYFTTFDLGLVRATTKFVAGALAKGDQEQIAHLVWTAAILQAAFGILAGVSLAAITPLLVANILHIESALTGEAKLTFYLLALCIPILLLSASFSGVLEGAQRFDLVNAIKIPSTLSIYLFALVGLLLGFRLPGILALILAVRLAALWAIVALDLHVFPEMRKYAVDFSVSSRLFGFGRWIAITGMVAPVLMYADRFLISWVVSTNAVAYYTAPYEVITRLWMIPASLVAALFPAFSALEGRADWERLGTLLGRSIKYMLLLMGPITIVLMLFAREILEIWLGAEFATRSKVAAQVLAVGMLACSIGQAPYVFLQAVGRPDLIAKYHLLELLPYIGLAWAFVTRFAIVGAAVAFAVRLTLAAVLLPIVVCKVCGISPRWFLPRELRLAGGVLLAFSGAAWGLKVLGGMVPPLLEVMLFAGVFAAFVGVTWRRVLSGAERKVVLSLINVWRLT